MTLNSGDMHVKAPRWGSLSYFTTYATALTCAGELHLCFCVPSDPKTSDAFSVMCRQPGVADIFRLDSDWPQKLHTAAS